jgi:hypothetical protein
MSDLSNPLEQRYPCLTIWQPYASLLMLGEKRFETRGWRCTYRLGTVFAIHAAARQPFLPADDVAFCKAIAAFLERHHMDQRDLPLGSVLGLARLVSVRVANGQLRASLPLQELCFGDFSDDRFAWEFQVERLFPEPVPARGQQGIWYWQPNPTDGGKQ